VRTGVSAMLTETLKATLAGGVYQLVEGVEREDMRIVDVLDDHDPPRVTGHRHEEYVTGVDDSLGWEIDASLSYAYSKDLSFEVGYAHFFSGDALGANVTDAEGFAAGSSDADDMNYVYAETKLCF
jgi:hypothetical protein